MYLRNFDKNPENMKHLLTAGLLLLSLISAANNGSEKELVGANDTLNIAPNLDSAYAHFTAEHRSELFEGYTIQLFSGDRSNANQVRAKILSLGADKEARMVYREPNFKIHVGSFPDASSAERALMSWKLEFPDAFVVKTMVPWYELDLEVENAVDTTARSINLDAPSDTTNF